MRFKSFLVYFIFLFLILLSCNSVPIHRVIVDPGHGGANIFKEGKWVKSDRWDPVTKSYLSYYLTGMEADEYKEHLVMLSLSKDVKKYLDWTKSLWGWYKFKKLLQKFSSQKNFPRIILYAKLTRKDSWNHRFKKENSLRVNDTYRMYDYPDARGRIRYGRLSFINQSKASLVVSLHMTPAGRGNKGGMASVLSPGFSTFNLIRQIHLKEKLKSSWKKTYWHGKILGTEGGWDQFQLARGDAWGYFHGYRSNRLGTRPNFNAPRGIRHNLITWAYKEKDNWYEAYQTNQEGPYALEYTKFKAVGKFWEREKRKEEQWRREGGPLLYGGDNHYASDELLRFVQYGVRLLKPEMREKGRIGKIHFPFVSSYTLPIYVNAIVAYLEIGYLNRKRDRDLIIGKQASVAQSIAVGIYSLYSGISLRPLNENPYPPQGKAIDFVKYGSYFNDASK